MLYSKLCKTLVAASALAWPVAAIAGPCSDDIAQLTRQLDSVPGLGATVSGVAAGSTPGARTANENGVGNTSPSDRAQPGGASRTGGGSAGTVGGVSGTAVGAKDAVASGQVATSDQDVRSQSVGKPTAAQAASGGSGSTASASDDRASQAKMSLQTAIDLNAKNDPSCAAAVTRTRGLMPKA